MADARVAIWPMPAFGQKLPLAVCESSHSADLVANAAFEV